MINVRGLVKEFPIAGGVKVAIDDISFDIEEGEFFTLLGPSGCGKTTTLRSIAGLEKPTAGTIAIDDQKVFEGKVLVPANKRQIGMVFQSYAVWPHMKVFENVAFPLQVSEKRISKKEISQRVEEALGLVDLSDVSDRMATQLSGGQQQRLSLARALVRRPKLLLLDEPLSNLDAKLRERMRSELRVIQRQVGITTLFVTHDQVEALSMSDRVAVMNEGKIEQVGTPEQVYHDPASAFVADFIGGANMFEGIVDSVDSDGLATLKTDLGLIRGRSLPGLSVGGTAVAAIHLEDVILTTDPSSEVRGANVLPAKLGLTLFNGSSITYRLHVGDRVVEAQLGAYDVFESGAELSVVFPRNRVRILPRIGKPYHPEDDE